MKIAFNPSTVAALITPPNNKDITFDLRGRNIFARGVKFCGTDTNTWRDIKINNVSIGSNILDLRNGSNTTLTNTNGVVTINSTWRPVVDNLTSDSTTSSLSANQGRVLKSLIDGKSNSDHNHDGRYLRLNGSDTMQGNLNLCSIGTSYIGRGSGDKSGADFTEANIVIKSWWGISFKSYDDIVRTYIDTRTGNIGTKGVLNAVGAVIQGRVYNDGDDGGIIIKPSSNGYAGLILGTHNGERSVFYLTKGNSFWRYNNGSTNLDIQHPKKPGVIALTSDIPSSLKNPYSLTTFGVVYDGSAAKTVTTSTFISQVTEGTSTITDGTMLITSYASNSGFADTNAVNVPYKRKAIHLWEYIKTKTDSLYATKGHNHDDRYLKLTGGTMSGTIYRNSGGATISGRDNAIIRQTYAPGGSSWNPIACVDTETGTWTLGHLSSGSNNTDFNFCFSTNADYNAGNNNGNYVTLRNKVGTIALLSEIPDKNSWNYDDRYLKLTGGTMNGNARIGYGSGNLYIGNSGNDGWVAVQDICSQDSIGDGKWSIRVDGTASFQSIKFPSNRLIAQVSSGSNSPLKGIKLPYLENNGIGIFSRVGNGSDEGGIVLSEDTCVIYNSFDTGWGLSVRDKDINQTDISGDNTIAFGVRQDYRAYSLGGFEKSGSDNSYVLLGGGGHKTLSDFATSTHTHGLLHSNLTVTLANTTTDSGWSMINSSYNGFLLKSIRTQGSAPNWIENNYAAGICFGGADTKGVVSVAYGTPYIKFAGGNGSKPVWWIRLSGISGATYNLANFNAASATKLQTPRTIWGQSFDGTGDVSGSLSNTGTITASTAATYDIGSNALDYRYGYFQWIGAKSNTNLRLAANDSDNQIVLHINGNVGVGTNGPTEKLTVNGWIGTNGIYTNRTGSSTDGGVSLYSNVDPMTYGIAFRGTGTYGTHGYVTSASDWATYLTMNDSTTRGWIFRRGDTNVASIAGSGNMAIGQHLEFSNGAHISTNRSTDYHYGYTFNLGDNTKSIGMYSGPVEEAGGVVISPDGCLIYNSSDCGYNLQVRDKDLGSDLTNIATLTFGIEQSGYYAWSRGGFKKNGSSNSYVLLGDGGHQTISSLSVNYANSAGNADTVDGYHANAFAAASHTHPYLPLSGAYITGTNIADMKVNIRNYFNGKPAGTNCYVGSPNIIYNFQNDSAACDANSVCGIMALNPGYDNYNHGHFLVSHYGDNRIGMIGLGYSTWYGPNWFAYTSDIPIVTDYYWANIKVSASSSTSTSPTFGSLWINNSHFFKQSGTTFTCQGGTTFTLPSSSLNTNTALLWTTASDGTRDTGIFYNSSDFAFIANSNDHGAVFAVYDTDVTQDFEAGAREISVPGNGGALWARGGFSKSGSSNDYVLLGGGGHKAISDFMSSTIKYALSDTIGGNALQAYKLYYPSSPLKDQAGIDNFHEASTFKYALWNGNLEGMGSSFPGTPNGIILSGGWTTTTYGFQLAIDDDPNYFIALRQRGNGTWSTWKRIPMGDGTGASGTWGINITGNADTVDGYHVTSGNDKPWGTIPAVTTSGWMDIGKHLEFHFDNTTGSDYSTILRCTGNYSNIVNLPSAAGTLALTSDIPTTLPANGGNADTTDGVHITWAGELTSTSHLVAWEANGSALRDINPANVTVGNSDKLDGYHANSLLTALSNSNNGISITVGGTTKSISNISVNYAASAGSASSATQATNLTPENTPHYFRDPSNSAWRGGMYWGSAGNESMSFVAVNSSTRFQFVGGSDIANWTSSTWQSVTPYLTIYSSGIVTPGSVTATNGFHHVNHDNNDAVLLAGGGYSQGVPVKYWSIESINIYGPTQVARTNRGGNYTFVTKVEPRIKGSCVLTLQFPSGYNDQNTIIWAIGVLNHDISNSSYSTIYATILQFSGSKYYLNLSDDDSLNNGSCQLYFMCF